MGAKVRALVVDGGGASREGLVPYLQQEGFDVTTLSSARDALSHLKSDQVQILLVDPGLPEVVSGDLLKEVERANPDISVILLFDAPRPGPGGSAPHGTAGARVAEAGAPADWRTSLRNAIIQKGLCTGGENRLNAAIGRRIREIRRERGLTLRQLASRTGLSVSLISQIELAKSAASILTLHRLVTALGYDLSGFFSNVM
jgi:CheY-like chemotaxis protein